MSFNIDVSVVGLAGRVVDEVIKAPHEPSILFPRSGGNIHSFTALTPCAILDVLSPPYSEEFGRPSTYFSDIHIPSLNGNLILDCLILFIYLSLGSIQAIGLWILIILCAMATGYAILEEKQMPRDLVVQGAPYLGPSIVTVDDYNLLGQIGFDNHV